MLSYAEYAAIDDDRRYQVLEGELFEMTSPTPRHQRLALRMAMALANAAQASGAGEVFVAPLDVVLAAERPATVVQPDVFFVAEGGRAIVAAANVQGPPDLVIEVLSPSSARLDTVRKLSLYARFGVLEAWFVSNEFDEVSVHRLDPATGRFAAREVHVGADVLRSPLLPALALSVADLFAGVEA